jgi:hypothetical protein
MTVFLPTSTGRNGTIQTWVVPATGDYSIEAWGAQGGSSTGAPTVGLGGLGARMYGEFTLTAGETIKILVGQQGIGGVNSQASHWGGGGGGGTFVTRAPHNTTGSILVIAGGGGGGYYYAGNVANGTGGTTGTSGLAGQGGNVGGSNGGAGAAANGGRSSGFSGNGDYGSLCYVQGGTGGLMQTTWGDFSLHGGFGGGGGAGLPSGGGGGYSGGGGGTWSTLGAGGGGGSYNSGTNQSNTSAVKSGAGQVEILSTNAQPNAPVILTPADNVTVNLTSGLDFTYTYSDPEGDAQVGYALKRRTVNLGTGGTGLAYGTGEWWNGTAWVGTETTVVSTTQPISTSGWPVSGDTYQYGLATSDAGGLGAYSAYRTVNPYEWWDGTAWVPMVEGYVVSTSSEVTLSAIQNGLVEDFNYNWTVSTKDNSSAAGPYASMFTFTAGGGSLARIWNGTAWVDHEILVRSASGWVEHDLVVWDGTAWVDY